MNRYIKLVILIIIIGIANNTVNAQNKKGKSDDFGRIILNSYVAPQAEGIPPSAKRMLTNKLSQIASKNGMGGSDLNPRFIITPNITILTKDLTSTAPPMTALTMEITFYIGDGIEGTLFANTSIEVKGVGTNETKAYISGLKRINPSNPTIKNLVEEGKTKIIEYYNSKCDFIIKEASAKSNRKNFDEAIASLLAVPEVISITWLVLLKLNKPAEFVGSLSPSFVSGLMSILTMFVVFWGVSMFIMYTHMK